MTPTSHHKPIPAILQTLVASSRIRVARLRAETTFEELSQRGRTITHRSFRRALESTSPAIIAEVKKASPSKGVLSDHLDPVVQVNAYASGGCAAISVVTEPEHFLGDWRWIEAIRDAVAVPLLRKDFIIDPIQVAETAAAGADAILLIARILSPDQLAELSDASQTLNLDVLYEAHDESDIDRIAQCDPQLVGVNARDLEDFTVDTERVKQLRAALPQSAILIAESGIEQPEQIAELREAGYHAFLVGEALLRSEDPAALLRQLRGET
ncbi:MAG: indole-3-glycerol phosphate synthase TrpC [candidate division Zixibacteria bacterium]|nr:indole-3-glycerol phosphate synthase TrpC [candidate division Zixibacteria bacterium]